MEKRMGNELEAGFGLRGCSCVEKPDYSLIVS